MTRNLTAYNSTRQAVDHYHRQSISIFGCCPARQAPWLRGFVEFDQSLEKNFKELETPQHHKFNRKQMGSSKQSTERWRMPLRSLQRS